MGRDCKSSVFCRSSVYHLPLFLHVNDVITCGVLQRLGHRPPVANITDKGRKEENVLAGNGNSCSYSCFSVFQGYKRIHSSMTSMTPKNYSAPTNIFCKPQQQAPKKLLKLTAEGFCDKRAGKICEGMSCYCAESAGIVVLHIPWFICLKL